MWICLQYATTRIHNIMYLVTQTEKHDISTIHITEE